MARKLLSAQGPHIMDGLGRTIQKREMPSKDHTITTHFTYTNVNPEGNSLLASATFADGSVKTQTFDQLGRLIKVVDPDRSTTHYTYTPDNMLASVTDANGVETLFTYDGLQRRLSRQQKGRDDTKVTYQYDQLTPQFKEATFLKGRLVHIKYPGGHKYYSYDQRGNLTHLRHIMMGHTFDFKTTYNNAGEALSTRYPDGRALSASFDGIGRLLSVKDKIKHIQYNALGLRETLKWANGATLSYGYDALSRINTIDVSGVMTLRYQYDEQNNPTHINQTHGDVTFTNTYSYDSLYRLTQANLQDGKEVLRYKQDDLHNITQKSSSQGGKSPAHIGAYTYDTHKVHAAKRAGKHTLAYDEAGNMTKRNDVSLTWDYLHRLVQASQGGKAIAKYWYANNHYRAVKEEAGVLTFYIDPTYEIREGAIVSYLKVGLDREVATWRTKGVAAFFDDLDKDGHITGSDAWRYHATKQGFAKAKLKPRPLALNLTKTMLLSSAHRMLLGDKEHNHYYHSDMLGNVRAVTDDKGKVIVRKHYHPYGTIRAQSGQTQVFSYGYQGQEYDKALGVWAYLKRSLDPRLGRWLSADPMFAQMGSTNDEFNSYGMVQNNPIAYRDKHGTNPEDAEKKKGKKSTKQPSKPLSPYLEFTTKGAKRVQDVLNHYLVHSKKFGKEKAHRHNLQVYIRQKVIAKGYITHDHLKNTKSYQKYYSKAGSEAARKAILTLSVMKQWNASAEKFGYLGLLAPKFSKENMKMEYEKAKLHHRNVKNQGKPKQHKKVLKPSSAQLKMMKKKK